MKDYPLNQLILVLRDFVNQPGIQQRLMSNRGLWLQLCSCMDAIGDTELAVASYQGKEYASTQGGRYLALYGLLQSMFLQQDAVENLCDSLHIPLKLSDYPKLGQVRNIRNDSVGHPTRRDRRGKSKPKTYSFISRVEMQHDAFMLLTFGEDGSRSNERIRIPELLEEQSRALQEMLTVAIRQLKQDDQAHKDKFKMVKLAEIFAMSVYHVEKINEGVLHTDKAEFAGINVNALQMQLQRFDASLTARDIDMSELDSLADITKHVKYALDTLAQYFASIIGNTPTPLESQGAYIFAWFVSDGMRQIKDVATNIDDDYADAADID